MKRILLFTALMAVSLFNVYAYDFSAVAPSGQTLYYNIVDGHAEVVRPGTGSSYNNYFTGDLIIPDTVVYNGVTYSVTTLATNDFYGTFYGCSGLTSVTIPNSVTSIGERAFYNCSGLTSVTIPNSVTSIGERAFYNCSGLTSVTIPNSVTSIGERAFYNCSGLTSVTIGNSVTSIGLASFYNCSGLTSVTIPNSVTSIGGSAFEGCSGLTSVTIPNSVTSIGGSAFEGCSGLTSVTIPNSVTSIGGRAFYNCSGLTSVNYTGTIAQWCSIDFSVSSSNPTYYSHSLSINGSPLTNLVIPEGVAEIKQYTFFNCSGLTSVTIGNSVANIGSCAFYNCSGLTSVTIGNSVTSIGNYAFEGCSGLSEVWLKPTTPPTLGNPSSLGANTIPLVVPNNSYNAYISAVFDYGGDFGYSDHPIYRDSIIVTTLVNDTIRGYVTGGDTVLVYPYDTITLTAIANYGYHFGKWDDNSTDNPLRIVTDSNITRTAFFNINQYHILATSDTTIHGTVQENSWSYHTSGIDRWKYYLELFTMYVRPNHGYHFTHWQDGDTNNPRTFILTQDTSFVAFYDKNSYTLTFQSDDTNKGIVNTVSVSGEYLDTTMLIYANALPHYHFVRWNDNNTENPRRFVIDDSRTYTAYFSIDVHNVSVQVDNIAQGTVEGSGSREYGQPITVSATPFSGYKFSHWSNGSTYNPYTFAVLEDKTLTAFFIADGEPYQDTLTLYDTLYVDIHDTTYIDVHDTTYLDVPYPVHDTTIVHDTTYVDVPYPVHDTTIVHDTTYVDVPYPVHDTTIVHDTTYVDVPYPVHDTTIVHDTTYVDVPYPVHDTTIVHDTTYVDVPYPVHDTTIVHDTTYVDVPYPVHDTTIVHDTTYVDVPYPVHDTTIVTVTDTVTNTVYDTITNTVFDTITNTVYDTTIVFSTDTLWLHDTVFVHDTIYIHDTIVVGMAEVDVINAKIYVSSGQIVVDGTEGNTVWLYDVNGRILATKQDEYSPLRFDVTASGTYLVKIGDHPARKVVVIR